jgi:hypothetical protein
MSWESGLFISYFPLNMKSDEQMEISLKVLSMKCQDEILSWVTGIKRKNHKFDRHNSNVKWAIPN